MDNQLELTCVSFKKNSYLILAGKQNTGCFFIIKEGRVMVSKEAAVKGEKNELLGPGDFVGVVSAMSFQNHIESAAALTDVVVIKVMQSQYIALIQKNPTVTNKIIKQFSNRLRALNDTLAELTMKNTAQEGPSHLFNVAEYYLAQKQYQHAFYAYVKYYKNCPDGDKIPEAKKKMMQLSGKTEKIIEHSSDELNRTYKKNTMIFAEGEPGNELFIIQKGSVKISKVVDKNEVLLAILKVGDVFGEMALLEDKPRLASAVAHEDCKLMAVNKINFELMIKSQPQLIAKITSLLSDRIWLIYKKLDNALMDDPMGRLYNTIYLQLEKNRVPLDGSGPLNYGFNFGWAELFGMTGLPAEHNKPLHQKISNNSKIQIYENSINITSIMEIVRQTEYYRKMDKRDKLKNKEQGAF